MPGIPLSATTRAAAAKNIIGSLKAMPKDMSNALVVNGSQTKSGHPIAVFGPQVSYFAPQILSILDIHAPDYAAMGASVRALADELDVAVGVVLEGGYDLGALSRGLVALLEVLAAEGPVSAPALPVHALSEAAQARRAALLG